MSANPYQQAKVRCKEHQQRLSFWLNIMRIMFPLLIMKQQPYDPRVAVMLNLF